MPITDITEVARKSNPLRAEIHWVGNERKELEVCHIPIEYLYFNIENGRYADRMIRLPTRKRPASKSILSWKNGRSR